MDKIRKNDEQWREELTPEQYAVCRQQGTERPFTGVYNDCKEPGLYRCVCCAQPLFSSETKFESGSGWPSFWAPVTPEAVETVADDSLGMRRIEVRCSRCDAHLGHVFEDGPPPTGLRYCMNSVCLELEPQAR